MAMTTPEDFRRGMKAKTIRKTLRKLVDAWLASIENEHVRELAKNNTIITGGCLASMLLGESINDFDFYFRTKEATVAIAQYYLARFKPVERHGIQCKMWIEDIGSRVRVVIKSAGIASESGSSQGYAYFEGRPDDEAGSYVGAIMGDDQSPYEVLTDAGDIEDIHDETEKAALEAKDKGKPLYRPVFMSTNAITLSHRVQIILRFFGEPNEIHENYDFVHCTNYWTSWDNELTLRPAALEALLSRELKYVGSLYPLCSIIRLRKFIARGWTVNAGQILKMIMQVNDLDLKKPYILQDQLTGVDAAYFVQLMEKLNERDPEKVDTAYLVEIIDRLF